MTAGSEWEEALSAWGIPDEILAQAEESPWAHPTEALVERARRAVTGPPTPTRRLAAESLPSGGVLLDVGCGAGAASLPVGSSAGRLVGVDPDREALDRLALLAPEGLEVVLVEGTWPSVAPEVGPVDVAVAAHVAYDVAALSLFVETLTTAARHRVVLELTDRHPLAGLSPYFERLFGLVRPDRPTALDAAAVVGEALGEPPFLEHWTYPRHDAATEPLEAVRRRLCLTPARDAELRELLEEFPLAGDVEVTTIYWAGRAS